MLKLASSLGFALALAELKQRIRRLISQGILGAIGAVLFLIGLCFLLVALHLWLSSLLNPIASAAIIGGALVLFALIFFLAAKGRGSARTVAAPATDTAQSSMAGLGDLFASPAFRNQTILLAGTALVLGFLFGRRTRGDGGKD